MRQEFVLGQLRTGEKTVREIAEAYVALGFGKSVFDETRRAQQRINVLRDQGYIESVGTVRMTYEALTVKGRIHTTHDYKIWRLVE